MNQRNPLIPTGLPKNDIYRRTIDHFGKSIDSEHCGSSRNTGAESTRSYCAMRQVLYVQEREWPKSDSYVRLRNALNALEISHTIG